MAFAYWCLSHDGVSILQGGGAGEEAYGKRAFQGYEVCADALDGSVWDYRSAVFKLWCHVD